MSKLTVIKAIDYLDQIDFDPAIVGRTMSYERIRLEAFDLVSAAEDQGFYMLISDMTEALVRIRNNGGVR